MRDAHLAENIFQTRSSNNFKRRQEIRLISYIKGTVAYKGKDSVVIENHGIGYQIKVPSRVLEGVNSGEEAMLRKCVVFYSAIGSAQPPEKFALDNIGNVSFRQIKRDLNSVLRKGERFDLEFVQKEVKDYLTSVLVPTKEEKLFWKAFSEGNYYPDWVFGDSDEFRNIAKHPMALWKCRDKEEDKKPLDKDHEKRV